MGRNLRRRERSIKATKKDDKFNVGCRGFGQCLLPTQVKDKSKVRRSHLGPDEQLHTNTLGCPNGRHSSVRQKSRHRTRVIHAQQHIQQHSQYVQASGIKPHRARGASGGTARYSSIGEVERKFADLHPDPKVAVEDRLRRLRRLQEAGRGDNGPSVFRPGGVGAAGFRATPQRMTPPRRWVRGRG